MKTKSQKGIVVLIFVFLTLMLVINFFFTPYILWYAKKEWLPRRASKTIEESMRRGVFVKKLEFVSDSSFRFLDHTEIFLEKGFRYKDMSEETGALIGSQYPYQLVYPTVPEQDTRIILDPVNAGVFDSTSYFWGYLKEPHIRDTLFFRIKIGNEKKEYAIKAWEPRDSPERYDESSN